MRKRFYRRSLGVLLLVAAILLTGCTLFQKKAPEGPPLEASVPTDGLQLWLRADKGFSKAADQSVTWNDQSGHNRHATAPAGSELTLDASGANSRAAVKFDGDAQTYLVIPHDPDLNADNGLTVFVVYSYRWGLRVMQKGAGSGTAEGQWFVSTREGLGVSGKFPDSYFTADHGLVIQSGVYDPATGTVSVYHDGVAIGEPITDVPEITVTNEDDLYIGMREHSSPNHLEGMVAEILVYNKALDDETRQTVETYLRVKYGL